MKLYLLRHGQTQSNKELSHHVPSEGLNDEGRAQAERVRETLRGIEFDSIYSSSLSRAQETADIVRRDRTVPFIVRDEFQEMRRPSELFGKHMHDPQIHGIHELIIEHGNDPLWHYSDEENFYDFRSRVHGAMDFILQSPYECVLVVTHGHFMRMAIGLTICGEDISFDQFSRLRDIIHIGNCMDISFTSTDRMHWILSLV